MIRRVLIVNDSHIERTIAKESLSDDYMVFEANSGLEAYDILDKEEVDIIFLDNLMKDETGYDIAKRLRKNHKYDNTPIVLMTSNDNPINELEAFESGFNAYLHKSKIKEIVSLIKSLEKSNLENPVKVLIVDDSRIIRTMLSYTFNKEGFTIKTAENGKEALEILKTYKPDFITMDVDMPGIDGYHTSKLIRGNPETTDIPIIMITSVNSVESRIKGFESGVVEYYTKPFEPMELIEYIKNVILKINNPVNKKILLIEETLSTQHFISYTLSKNGFEVICLSKTDEIWNVYKKEKIDLILIDFDLGITQSYDLCKRLKEESTKQNKHIPIIVITSIQNKHAIIESFRMGADDYISRPFTTQELIIRVLTHLSYKENSLNKKLNKNEESHIINKDFISALNHDLRSPVTSVYATAELLLKNSEKYGINKNREKFIKNIL
ncbi:MAG: response regulator, partial [Spirochaetota bacterium]